MNRREFLTSLGGAAAGVALSPLLDLSAVIAAPSATCVRTGLMFDEINAVTLRMILPRIADTYFRTSPLLDYLKHPDPITFRGVGVYGISD